jgi:hypothetical protein
MAAVASAGIAACSVSDGDLPRPGTCKPFELVDLMPAPDSVDVPPDIIPAVTFNDFPDPDTISLSTVVLYTGFFYHTGHYWVDLVERRAFFQPSGELALGLGYSLVLKAGIRSMRGCDLEMPTAGSGASSSRVYAVRFQTLDPGADRHPQPVPPSASYGQVVDLFGAHCAGSSCHLDSGRSPTAPEACLAEAAGSLSLCARDAHAGLVGVPSRQVIRLARVAPRDSARSYLLRKLIGAPPIVGHAGAPEDELSTDDLHIIQSWIDGGAAN